MNIGIVRIESEAKLPWRKPEERPEFERIIWALVERHSRSGPYLYEGEIEQVNRREVHFITRCLDADPESFEWKYVRCWLYAEDIPLPEWVK